MYRIIKAY